MRLAHGILTALLVFTTTNLRAQADHAKSIVPPPGREAFIANQGQWHPEARLLAPLNGLDVWVTSAGMTLDYYALWPQGNSAATLLRQTDVTDRPARRTGHIVRMEFSDVSARAGACGADQLPGYLNYFLGNDPSRWVTHVNRFREAQWTELYEGVDGRLRIEAGRPRYDLIVQPGADPTVIRIRFDGADGLRLNSNAELALATSLGEVTQRALFAYQMVDERTVPIECHFILIDPNTVGFALGAYDATRPLIIDPLTSLAYSTFLGGSGGSNRAEDIIADSAGNLYVTGRTTTPQYPTTLGAYDTDFDVAPDAFVSKIAPLSGGDSDLLFSTFVGGNAWDYGYGIALDGQNNVYIAGITQSSNYPVSAGAYDSSYNGAEDAFVTKLDSSGSILLYSTYLGGTGREDCYEIAVTPGGLAVVTGMTWWQSSGFPTTAFALQPSFGGGSEDAFLSVIAPLGNGSADLVYSTFLGGGGDERGFAVATEPIIGSLYVTGRTSSPNFHTTRAAYDTSFNGQEDIFVLKFIPTDVAGYQLSYGTYLGGPASYDDSFGIAVDPTGAVYVAGYSFQFSGISGYPTTAGAYDTSFNGGEYDTVVSKLRPNGQGAADLVYSTFIGGNEYDTAYDIAVDTAGRAYVTGRSWSLNYPTTPGTYDASFNGYDDVVVTVLNSTGCGLVYSSWLGGSFWDWGLGIAADGAAGKAHLTGATWSYNYPTTPGAYDTVFSGTNVFNSSSYDVFVTSMNVPPIGDMNLDGSVALSDYAAFAACLAGPNVPLACACANADLDADSDADLADAAVLQHDFAGGP